MQRKVSFRWVNLAIGTWLFSSAFIWRHASVQFTNTWFVGAACMLTAAIGLRVDGARYVNALLALWLFISSWTLPAALAGTAWNNLVVGLAMLIVALRPGPRATVSSRIA